MPQNAQFLIYFSLKLKTHTCRHTQRQNKVKKRINPNQGPNLRHLPREEQVVVASKAPRPPPDSTPIGDNFKGAGTFRL